MKSQSFGQHALVHEQIDATNGRCGLAYFEHREMRAAGRSWAIVHEPGEPNPQIQGVGLSSGLKGCGCGAASVDWVQPFAAHTAPG